ncbi:MAG: SRPBCC family protein, partial [Anaerolineae bacterium]|nr:SRPBCC family protein [Anaerolineae bacterium]
KRWHTGYRNISVLTTQQMGLGTRRRCALATGGKDVIEEITAWAEGFGYEYTLIEGGPYRTLKGRLRLTAGPNGTTVQWTVTYTRKGIIGKLRNTLSGKRQMHTMMGVSLRHLRHQIDELGLRMDADYRARVSMRDRLDHDARLQYQQRRYAEEAADSGDATPITAIDDAPDMEEPTAQLPPTAHSAAPPVKMPPAAHVAEPSAFRAAEAEVQLPSTGQLAPPPEDTRFDAPDMDIATDAEIAIPDDGVPSFVDELLSETDQPDDYAHTADTEPKPPEGLREALEAQDIHEPTNGIAAQITGELAHENAAALVSDTFDAVETREPVEKRHTSRELPAIQVEPDDDMLAPDATPGSARSIPEVSPMYSGDPAHPPTAEEPALDAGEPIPLYDDYDDTALEHTRPTPPRGLAAAIREQATMTPIASDPDSAPAEPVSATPTPVRGTPNVLSARLAEEPRERHLPPPTSKTDTGEVSIWEVFGTQRPSEHDEHALQDLIESVSAREAAAARRRTRWAGRAPHVRHMQRVVGLRLRLIRRQTPARWFETRQGDTDEDTGYGEE